MGWKGNRSRTIRKAVTFSEEEWRWVADSLKVENRQRIQAGLRPVGWMTFARNRIRCAHRVNITVPANLHDVSAQLARIGNNVNRSPVTRTPRGRRTWPCSRACSTSCARRNGWSRA